MTNLSLPFYEHECTWYFFVNEEHNSNSNRPAAVRYRFLINIYYSVSGSFRFSQKITILSLQTLLLRLYSPQLTIPVREIGNQTLHLQ